MLLVALQNFTTLALQLAILGLAPGHTERGDLVLFIFGAYLRFEAILVVWVAGWYVFKPKIQICENSGGPYVEWKKLVYVMAIGTIFTAI
jgi:hypothetical protein